MLPRLAPLALALLCAAGCATSGSPHDAGGIAMAYAKAGRHVEAAREIELAVRVQPENVALRQRAASIQAGAGNLAKAVEHLEVAIRLGPSDPESWIALGSIEKRRGSASDAYVAYKRAAELAPEDLRAVSGLALSADSLGFDEEADRADARWTELAQAQKVPRPAPLRR